MLGLEKTQTFSIKKLLIKVKFPLCRDDQADVQVLAL